MSTPQLRRKRPLRPTCYCDAYPFPHRLFSGACCGMNDNDDESDEDAERRAFEAREMRSLIRSRP